MLSNIKSNYEDSKLSVKQMESNIATMDKEIAATKEEHASIDNLAPIPAGPPVANEVAATPKEATLGASQSAGGVVDPAKVKVMVTEQL